jgi:DNA (cytosine-5)-methyltransferase 1
MTFGSLFTGFGGIDLGLERAGLTCAWQVEINDYATRVLEHHWPGIRRHRDVATFPAGESAVWETDLIVGGDPCQENSKSAGSRSIVGSSPAVHFLRIVGQLRPRFVLRENPWPSRADAPWSWQRFRSGLESIGYAVLPFRLRSCCLGAEHRRDRVFLLAELANANGIDGETGIRESGREVPAVQYPRRGPDQPGMERPDPDHMPRHQFVKPGIPADRFELVALRQQVAQGRPVDRLFLIL